MHLRSESYLAEDLIWNIEVRVIGIPKVLEIAPHELGKPPRMRHLLLEYVPAVLARLLGDLPYGSTLLGTPVVSSMVERIVHDDAYDTDFMGRIGASEVIERIVQQREPDRREVLRPDRNENVP